jgi:hypothetical protein
MLVGKAPFSSPENISDSRLAKWIIESNIVNHKISFPSNISSFAIDLITQLLNPDPKRRPWIE